MPFDAIWSGRKTYEIRKNDRGYEVGDVLVLRRWDPDTEQYSMAPALRCRVTYITPGGEWGLPEDLCVMAVQP